MYVYPANIHTNPAYNRLMEIKRRSQEKLDRDALRMVRKYARWVYVTQTEGGQATPLILRAPPPRKCQRGAAG